jgi:hypothetical protein
MGPGWVKTIHINRKYRPTLLHGEIKNYSATRFCLFYNMSHLLSRYKSSFIMKRNLSVNKTDRISHYRKEFIHQCEMRLVTQ